MRQGVPPIGSTAVLLWKLYRYCLAVGSKPAIWKMRNSRPRFWLRPHSLFIRLATLKISADSSTEPRFFFVNFLMMRASKVPANGLKPPLRGAKPPMFSRYSLLAASDTSGLANQALIPLAMAVGVLRSLGSNKNAKVLRTVAYYFFKSVESKTNVSSPRIIFYFVC